MDDDQDMRHYGGLYRFMPITATTFIVGWLAIAGVPPFSGFWSKDEILLSAWDADITGAKVLWLIGLITALLTAFYMSRQVFLTFFGRHRYADVRPDEVAEAWESRVEASRQAAKIATAEAAETAAAVVAAKPGIAGGCPVCNGGRPARMIPMIASSLRFFMRPGLLSLPAAGG